MKKLLSTFLCAVSLTALLSLPAEARIVIGVIKGSSLSAPNQLAQALSDAAADSVQIRQFDDESALTNWLVRFQELDTAIVPRGYIAKQPAGSIRHMADLYLKSSATPLSVVSLSNLNRSKFDTIQKSLVDLGSTAQGKQALSASNLANFTLPGDKPQSYSPKSKVAAPKPAPVKPKPEPVKVELPTPAKKVAQAKIIQEKPPVKKAAPQEHKPATAKAENKTESAPKAPTQKQPIKEKPRESVEQKQQPVRKEATAVTPPVQQKPVAEKPEPREQTQQKKKSPASKRLILFVALIILVAILLKIALLVMRWQSRQRVIRKSAPPPSEESFTSQEKPVAPVEQRQEETVHEPLVVENGFLGPGKVPALLKRCADLPEPVVLKVTKGSCEKLIYFAAGQVSGAMTHNNSAQESGIRWNKLGSMLLREEFITTEEREQAMALIISEPNLRFGEALLKLGYITLAELRHALTRQAKITIYSLILFPEGKYEVFAENGALPAEESVSLEVTSLIREASHHKSEWMAIREALPNLNTALNFTSEGKDKLEQVNLSAQQQELLSQIDGKLSINELSANSSMMDYEVYRFLYMMVKTGVLE